jgi:hypothetical protein
LQSAVDKAGTIVVGHPGTYKLAGTVYVGSNTTLLFGDNVFHREGGGTGTLDACAPEQGGVDIPPCGLLSHSG